MRVRKKLVPPQIWLTVYGDFITNLTLFFMLLFGSILMALQLGLSKEQLKDFMQGISSAVYQKEEKVDLKELKAKMAKIEGITGIGINDKEVRVILSESVLFNRGQAKLKNQAKELLARVGATLPRKPNRVIIEGHSCDLPVTTPIPPRFRKWELALARASGEGPFGSNWELSAARALQVSIFLMKHEIADPDIIIAGACGPSQPLFPNDSEEHRARNRRIEIKILYDAK